MTGKGKPKKKKNDDVPKDIKQNYFSDIFQSEKTSGMPKVSDVINEVSTHDIYLPILDDIPSHNELDEAISDSGKGVSFDGLPPNILNIIPDSMKNIILKLMQNVFLGRYPKSWEKQILHAIPKDGHSRKDPEVRGIAIPPLFCKIYDAIIAQRFAKWFTPNKEHAAFRKGQGCLLPLFSIRLLFNHAKIHKETIFFSDSWTMKKHMTLQIEGLL